MPYTLKTQQIAVKDPDTGVYSGVDILTEQTTEGLLTEIIATGTEVKTDVAAQMATERSDFNTYVSGKEAELDQYKSTTETNINTYVTNKNQEIATMIADADEDVSDLEDRKQDVATAVSGMLSKGVDNTLTTANVPAESKAVGDLFETIVEGKSTQPNDKWNRLWIKPSASDYEIPTMDDHNELKSAAILSSSIDLWPNNYNNYFTDANDAPLNKIVHIAASITSAMVANLPIYDITGTLMTFSYLPTAVNTKCQIYIGGNNVIYTRAKTNATWTAWTQVAFANDVILSSSIDVWSNNYNNYFTDANDAPLNKIVNITASITSSMVANLPIYGTTGMLMTFSYLTSAVNTKCQIYIRENNVIYTRVKAYGTWTDWTQVTLANEVNNLKSAAILSSSIDLWPNNYNNYFTDANDAPLNKIVHITGEITSSMVANLPFYGAGGTLMTFSYLPTAVNTKCQIYIGGNNVIYTRAKTNATWTDWKLISSSDEINGLSDEIDGLSDEINTKSLSINDVVNIVKSEKIQINKDDDISYDGNTLINENGNFATYAYPVALSDYISVSYGQTYQIRINSVLNHNNGARNLRIHVYNANKEWIKQLKVINFTITKDILSFDVTIDDSTIRYLRFSVPTIINTNPEDNRITKISLFLNNRIFTSGLSDYLRYGLHTSPPSEGAFNAVKRARQLTDAKWTPVVNLPRTMLNTADTYLDSHGNSYQGQFTAGQQYEGLPYSYSSGGVRYIGINVPIDLFYSCLTNPNSALYKRSNFSGMTATYYGTTCSTIVGYALDLPNIDSNYHSSIKGMNRLYSLVSNGVRHNIDDMQIGDVLIVGSHVAMVGDIIKDGDAVTDIEILEGTRQGCTDQTVLNSELGGVARRFWMTIDEFFTWFDGFGLYRYAYIDSVKFNRNPYTPLLYGEKSMPIKYFPCMPYYGNKKVFKSNSNGDNVNILIHDTNYTHLIVYRNGVQYNSYEIAGLSSVDVSCEYGEAEYSANLVKYDEQDQITAKSVNCYWYTMPEYDFDIVDDDINHNISLTIKNGTFEPWYVTFASNATENNPAGFTIVKSNYNKTINGDEATYTFSVKIASNDIRTCILALQSSKYAYFKLQKTY